MKRERIEELREGFADKNSAFENPELVEVCDLALEMLTFKDLDAYANRVNRKKDDTYTDKLRIENVSLLKEVNRLKAALKASEDSYPIE